MSRHLNIKVTFGIFIAAAFLVAVMQPFGLSPDYPNYEIFFDMARKEFGHDMSTRFEPGFVLVSGLLANAVSSDVVVYGLLVILAVVIKLFVLEKFVPIHRRLGRYYLYLALVFYFGRFFPLHELTQLRASIAMSLILVIALMVWTGRHVRAALLTVAATCFHYSSLILIPFFYLPKLTRKTIVTVSVVAGALLHMLSAPLVSVAQGYFLVFSTYDFEFADVVNPFSPVFLPEFFIIVAALYCWNDLTELMRRLVTLQMIGFALFYGLIDFTVVATRGRDLFSIMWTVFLVQGAGVPLRMRVLLHVFVAMSLVLAIYQYFILNFFHR